MAELARYELERLSQLKPAAPVVPAFQDPRVRELSQRINAARELPVDQRKNLLEGIVSLYADEDWSQPAIAIAKRQLEQIEIDEINHLSEMPPEVDDADSTDEPEPQE